MVRLAKGSGGCQAQRPAWAEPQPGVTAPTGDMSQDLSLVTSPCPSCEQFWAGDFGDGAVEKENCAPRETGHLSHMSISQPRKLRPGLMVESGYNFLRTTELEFNRGGIKPSLNSKLQALPERP